MALVEADLFVTKFSSIGWHQRLNGKDNVDFCQLCITELEFFVVVVNRICLSFTQDNF